MIVGIDPRGALEGANPLFPFDWVEGSPQEAVRIMNAGRGCVVPDHFVKETGLGIGDSFTLVPPENSDHPVTYTIAGSVRLPGWHWQTKRTGFRPRTHRAAALVFADYKSVAADFQKPAPMHVWFSYKSRGVDPEQILNSARALGVNLQGEPGAPDAPSGNSAGLRLITAEAIRSMTRGAASRWIWLISQVPLFVVGIAGFGLLNVILASVRSRRWEMGVMRSIGITSRSLVLAILAEGDSVIDGVEHIERGYEGLKEGLCNLGAKIN